MNFTLTVTGANQEEIGKELSALAAIFAKGQMPATASLAVASEPKKKRQAKTPEPTFDLDSATPEEESSVDDTQAEEDAAPEVTAQDVLDQLQTMSKKNKASLEKAKSVAATICKKFNVKAISKLSNTQAAQSLAMI